MSAPVRLYFVYQRGFGYEPIIVVGRMVSTTFVGILRFLSLGLA